MSIVVSTKTDNTAPVKLHINGANVVLKREQAAQLAGLITQALEPFNAGKGFATIGGAYNKRGAYVDY